MSYQDQKQRAKQKLKQILSGRIDGRRVNIRRGHSTKWGPPLNPGWYGIPDGNRKYVVAPATIDIDDWLAIQAGTRPTDFGTFMQSAYQPTVEQAAASIQSGRNDIPTPVLEVKDDGRIPQEGRSRAAGAKSAGAKKMPIWVAVQVYK